MYDKMFKSDNEKLSTLLNQVQNHEIQLPDFQRGWVWEDTRIRALLASLTKGFPIGAIMLLESGGDFNFKCKNIEGSGNEEKEPQLMILDGQQRMTSTFLAMRSKNPVNTMTDQNKPIKRYYYLNMNTSLNSEVDRYDSIIAVDENKQIRENIGRDIVLDLSTREKEFENKMIPFNILSDQNELNEWRNEYQKFYNFNSEDIKQYQDIDDTILQQVVNYEVPYIKVLKNTPKEAVCQVFENVNQGGKPLTVFELITATFAADNFDLKEHWQNIKDEFSKYDTLKNFDNTSFLIAMTLLVAMKNGKTVSCKRKDVLNLNYRDYSENEEDLKNGFIKMYKLLVEMNIFSSNDIPYNTQFIPLSVICTLLGQEIENVSVKDKIKQWFWCGVFGELYGGANETRYANDVKQVYDWIKGGTEIPKTISDSNFSTMRLIGLQTKNSAAYKGIMALILGNKSLDWISGSEMGLQTYLDERSDIHHIFPQDYCIKMNYDKKKWNSIINKTPLYFSTNRYIGGVAPNDYINKIEKNKNIDKEKIKIYVESHLIYLLLL
ncbi:MAG: DUF262 domain-containing protein [Clostridia bacterium]|nr:DUF262 domain-containing protein [Clostridia bacterium]